MQKGIDRAALPGLLNLIDVLELIVDRFNQISLPKEDHVDHDEPEFYVLAEFVEQLDPLTLQGLEEFVTDASMIFNAAFCV
ncbi:MAG: hypothetical protein VXA39_12730 [Deltaproteobacteria bacterium]